MKVKEDINKQLEHFLDEVLQTAPSETLPLDFAEKIKEKVYHTFLWKRYLQDFLIAITIGLLSIALGVLVLLVIDRNSSLLSSLFQSLIQYKSLILGSLGLIILLFFYNYVLLNFMLHYASKRINKNSLKLAD